MKGRCRKIVQYPGSSDDKGACTHREEISSGSLTPAYPAQESFILGRCTGTTTKKSHDVGRRRIFDAIVGHDLQDPLGNNRFFLPGNGEDLETRISEYFHGAGKVQYFHAVLEIETNSHCLIIIFD